MENIILNTNKGYQELKPMDGYVITSYKEDEKIESYYSTIEICAPMNADLSIYRAITLDEDKKYEKQKENAIQKLRTIKEQENKRI